MVAVKRLPQADFIIALNSSGEAVEQGTLEELNVPGKYIHSLKVQLQGEDDGVYLDKHVLSTEEILQPVKAAAAAIDQSRKRGDWSIYKYYAKSLGYWGLGMFGLIVAVQETSHGLASTYKTRQIDK